MCKVFKTSVAALVLSVAAAFALPFISGTGTHASAETPKTAALKPVETSSPVAYRYFESPKSVFADANGIVVTDADKIVAVAQDMTCTERAVSAENTKRHNGYFVTLDGGVITYLGETNSVYSSTRIADFDIYGDTLYALGADELTTVPISDGALDTAAAHTVKLFSDGYGAINATKITVSKSTESDGVTVTVALDSEAFANKQDIAEVDETGALSVIAAQSDEVMAFTAMKHTGVVYSLTRDRITGYYPEGDGGYSERYTARDARMTDIYAYDGFIYGTDTIDALYKISADLTEFTELAASASASDGFFDMPTSAAVKNSTLYVADSINDRIALYGDELSYLDAELDNPVSVACDSGGTLYVAHGYNKICVIRGSEKREFSVTGAIKQIAVDADKRLYISTNKGLYASDDGCSPVKITDNVYKAITLGIGRYGLYALSATEVVKIDFDGEKADITRHCAADASAISIAVDLDYSVFILSRSSVTKVKGDETSRFDLTLDGAPYSLGFNGGEIVIASGGNKFVNYGDAIIVDTYKHRVFTVDGSAATGLDIKLIDDDYETPDIADNTEPEYYGSGLIRVALYDTSVFSLPMETPSVYTIAKGRKVIVPQYVLEDTREYSLVLIDNLTTGELIQGYVYRDSLSAPLPYEAPPAAVGTIYSNATPVYKYPSPNSQMVKGFTAVERSTQFEILDFVAEYRDDYNNLWYRISIAERCEGFILAANMSVSVYEPIFTKPAYNAEIISYEGSESAHTYALIDGEYVMLDVSLATGTEVEVIGAFDTSEKYTKVKYLDANLGTLTCYVETVYLKYNGVNVVLIVAIVIIIVTVILGAIIIGRVMYLKKKRPVTSPDDAENKAE